MDPKTVLAKTPLGVEAVNQRSQDVPRALRHALILVDGRSTLAELTVKGSIIPEFANLLRELLTMGLIAPRDAERAATPAAAASPSLAPPSLAPPSLAPAATGGDLLLLRAALSDLATGLLGQRAGKIVRKIEEASASRQELSVAVEASYKLIRLTIDEALAEEFRRSAKALLG